MKIKKAILIRLIFYPIFVAFLLFAFRFRIAEFVNDTFYCNYELEKLTIEQKLEDFEDYYTTILESVPYLESIEELYQIDFEERKNYYIEEIKGTKTNVEYFGVMEAISNDLASFHTDVCFPLYSNLQGLNCYQSRETLTQFGMKAKMDAWIKEIEATVYEYEDVGIICVCYVDGMYIVEENELPEDYQEKANYELISIDGITADEYLINHISLYDLRYDYKRDKAYRNRYILNDSIGKEVEVLWKDTNGKEIKEKLYVDYGVEVVAAYGYLFEDKSTINIQNKSSIYTYRDEINQLEYVIINDFANADGEILKSYLENTVYNKIVIDLRNNYGGYIGYGQKYLYPALYGDNISYSYSWKVPNSRMNQAMINDWTVKMGYNSFYEDGFYIYSDKVNYKGAQKTEKEVYYLIGPNTGSAADRFIAMIKENQLGVVVGTNTGGEGLGASFICSSLENSSLVYTYFPSVHISENGQNPCSGTAPDIYISQSREDFELREKYEREGVSGEYAKRLEYDTALKWVVSQ